MRLLLGSGIIMAAVTLAAAMTSALRGMGLEPMLSEASAAPNEHWTAVA